LLLLPLALVGNQLKVAGIISHPTVIKPKPTKMKHTIQESPLVSGDSSEFKFKSNKA